MTPSPSPSPPPYTYPLPSTHAPVLTARGRPSAWRILLAFTTGGLSLLLTGWRKSLGDSKVVRYR